MSCGSRTPSLSVWAPHPDSMFFHPAAFDLWRTMPVERPGTTGAAPIRVPRVARWSIRSGVSGPAGSVERMPWTRDADTAGTDPKDRGVSITPRFFGSVPVFACQALVIPAQVTRTRRSCVPRRTARTPRPQGSGWPEPVGFRGAAADAAPLFVCSSIGSSSSPQAG